MVEWQPIETAPKDGTDILILTKKHGIRVARHEPWAWAKDVVWFIALNDGPSGGTFAHDATHWMSLPHPPE